MTELSKRLITACIAIPLLILFVIKSDVLLFNLALSIVILFTALELASLFKFKKVLTVLFVCTVFLGMVFSMDFLEYYFYSFTSALTIFWIILFGAVMIFNNHAIEGYQSNEITILSRFIIGLFLIMPFGIYLLYLKQVTLFDFTYILSLFFLVWSVDVGSYVAGKLAGKKKLIKNVSPGKTIEGLIGGVISLYIVAIILYYGFNMMHQNSILIWFFVSSLVGVFAIFGDLTESMLKRMMNVKDSGSLLPGHGGLLDRLDSLLAATPMYCFCLRLFNFI